jgi:hypothetical protein
MVMPASTTIQGAEQRDARMVVSSPTTPIAHLSERWCHRAKALSWQIKNHSSKSKNRMKLGSNRFKGNQWRKKRPYDVMVAEHLEHNTNNTMLLSSDSAGLEQLTGQ